MNKTAYLLTAALGLAAGPQAAHAGGDGWAAFGGFIGGMIVSEIGHHQGSHGYRASIPVVHGPAYDRHTPIGYRQHVAGHYEVRLVQTWVPGYHTYSNNGCGNRIKVWHSGHYTNKKTRVWVANRSHGRTYSTFDHRRH